MVLSIGFRLYLLWIKKRLPQLDGEEISFTYTIPRIIGLKYVLSGLCRENIPLDRILSEIKRRMEGLAKTGDEIDPPSVLRIYYPRGISNGEGIIRSGACEGPFVKTWLPGECARIRLRYLKHSCFFEGLDWR